MLILSLKIDKQSFLSFWTDGSVMGWASTAQCHNSVHSEQFTLHITLHSTQMAQLRVGPAQHSGTTLYTLHITHYTVQRWLSYGLHYRLHSSLHTGHWKVDTVQLWARPASIRGPSPSVHTAQCSSVHSVHCQSVHTAHLCTVQPFTLHVTHHLVHTVHNAYCKLQTALKQHSALRQVFRLIWKLPRASGLGNLTIRSWTLFQKYSMLAFKRLMPG